MEVIDFFRILKAFLIFFMNNVQNQNGKVLEEMLAGCNLRVVRKTLRDLLKESRKLDFQFCAHVLNGCPLVKFHLQLQSFLLHHFFNFSLYVRTCQLQHDKSIACSKFPRAKFAFLPLFNAVWKTVLPLMLLLIFFSLRFFISSCDFVACGLIKYNGFQISGNRPDEIHLIIKNKF